MNTYKKGTTMSQFASIASSGSLKPADIEGDLLIVKPTEHIPEMPTAMGVADAIRVDVHDLTTGETHTNVLWFSKVLVSSLRPLIGQQILAHMGKGVAKKNQSAPWMLIDAADDDDAVAQANVYLAGMGGSTVTDAGESESQSVVNKLNASKKAS